MAWLLDLKLIPAFNFYLAVTFFASTALRVRQYWAVLVLIRTFGGRWPNLFKLVSLHKNIFLTWGTVLPLIVSLAMLLIQTLASRLLFPQAHLEVGRLLRSWEAAAVVGVFGVAMIAFDVWGILDVAEIDRNQLDKYFDQAEHWLVTWKAPVLRFLTFGRINPRKMVATEVRAALLSASSMLNYNLWWIAVQAGLRLLFGTALWVSWALLG